MTRDSNQANKKLLLVSYYWPPSGGAAVQRWLSLSYELAVAGWQVWVITVHEKYATYQLYDHSLINEVHPAVTVVHTKTIEPFGLYKLIFGKKSIPAPGFSNEGHPSLAKKVSRFIRGNFFIPDPRKFWKRYAVREAKLLINKYDIPVVVTAGPPHSTHFIGMALRNKYPIKWIADFHDLWTDVIYYNLLYHLPIVKKIDRNLERSVLEKADKIITVGENYKKKLLEKSSNIPTEKIEVLRIGYDEANFIKPEKVNNDASKFIITYTGTMAAYYNPEVFFKALSNVIVHYTDQKFILRFVGILSVQIRQLVRENNLEHIFEETGYVSHEKAVEYLQLSSMLLLVNPEIPDEKMIIPGKIYEYLAAGKPIINVTVKDAETALIIKQCNAGETFERNMQEPLQTFLKHNINQWQTNGTIDIIDNRQLVVQYSRKSICNKLIQFLESEAI